VGRALGRPGDWRAARLVPAPQARHAGGAEGFEISPFGIHWEALDEDVSVESLLVGRGIGGGSGARERSGYLTQSWGVALNVMTYL